MKYMLIQWIEDPPTWDVLPVDKIINGHCTIGNICDVSYEEESSPAKILNIGTRSAMMSKLQCLERSVRASREDEPESENELGRGKREKHAKIYTDSESAEDNEGSSVYVPKKKARTSNVGAKSILQKYREEKLSHTTYDTNSKSNKNLGKGQDGWKTDPATKSELQEIKNLILGLQAQVACLQKSIENKAKVPEAHLNATVACPETDHEPRTRDIPKVACPETDHEPRTRDIPKVACPETDHEPRTRDIPKVKIGPNTSISPVQYALIKWGDAKKATKELCIAVFGRQVLASHSVTGRMSNAFKGKEAKPQLDPAKMTDILEFMSAKSGISKTEIRKLIAQKCTDEEKLVRRRLNVSV